MTRLRLAAVWFALLAFATGCTGSASNPPPTPSSPSGHQASPRGSGSAVAARHLCKVPHQRAAGGAPQEGPTPPAIARIESEVHQVTGLRWEQPVFPDPVTSQQMSKDVASAFRKDFPTQMEARRTRVWRTMGVIPKGSSLEAQMRTFTTGQVIGFYEPITGQLVFIGSKTPTLVDRITLAHELTHAIDDQQFGLLRLNGLQQSCNDEAYQAALGAVEGSAQYFSMQIALRTLTLGDLPTLLKGISWSSLLTPRDVSPFVERLQLWPYIAGLSFMQYQASHGGTAAIDRALRHFPVSTDQIMHPQLYPGDQPVPVDVPDYGTVMGPRWHDLDVMTTGEEWLNIMLGLRLQQSQADEAAAGWGGGLYRAWAGPGGRVAVVLRTVWDTPADAAQFSGAMTAWLKGGGVVASVRHVSGDEVDVLFATDAATLERLSAAVGD